MKPFARLLRGALVLAAILSATSARAATLTFEELDPGFPAFGPLGGYAGFAWIGGEYVARPPRTTSGPGYALGTNGLVAAYTPGGGALRVVRGDRFTFRAAQLSSAFTTTELVRVEGFRDGSAVYGTLLNVVWLPARYQLDFADVDAVLFTPLGRDITIDDVEVTTSADTVPPTIQLSPRPPDLTAEPSVVLSGVAFDQDGSVAGLTATITVRGVQDTLRLDPSGAFTAAVPLAEGANEILIQATDRAGNTGRLAVPVTRDSTAPVLGFLAPASGAAIATVEFPVSVQVDDPAVTTVRFDGWLDAPVTNGVATATLSVPARQGPFSIHASAVDAAGNVGAADLAVVAALPGLLLSVDVASGSEYGRLPDDVLAMQATVAGPYRATVSTSSGETFAVAAGVQTVAPRFPLVEGPNTLWVAAADEGGQAVTLPVAVVYDTTPPIATFLEPANAAIVRGTVDVAIEASDASTRVAAVGFSVDGGAPRPAAGGPVWSAALDLGGLADGAHVVSAAVADAVGNVATPSLTVVADATPPVVSITAPAAGSWVRGVVTVAAEALDATSGVRSIRLLANDATIGACDAASRCEVALDTAVHSNGALALVAVATDRAGNEETAQAVVTIDNVAPSRFLRAPAQGQLVTGSVEIEVSVTDPGFARTECFVGGKSIGVFTEPAFRTTADVSQVADGPLDVACAAADLAGNVATERVTVTVRNWKLTLDPRVLCIRARPGVQSVVTLYVEGKTVGLLAPGSAHALALAVPGGSPAPLVVRAAGEQVGDVDRDGIPDLTLKFERAALLDAIRGGLSSGAIAPGSPVTVRLVDGDRTLGFTTVEVR